MTVAGLLCRSAPASDRRNLELTLSPRGEELAGRVLRFRRAALGDVLSRLSAPKQRRAAAAFHDFATAASEPSDQALWAMGWTTDAGSPALGYSEGAR
jgi:DNA-binding MarR family transcriptional regulator